MRPSILTFVKKLLIPLQIAYTQILKSIHMPSDPGPHMLSRLQNIFNEKPLLMSILKKNPPINIKLATLLEVLDTLKEPGVSDSNIIAFLARPAHEWSNEVFRN